MLKDIEILTDSKVGVAVVYELNSSLEMVWNAYVLNLNNTPITNVLVTCKGFGLINDETRETSTMRYFLGDMEPRSFLKIEPINPDLFVLSNEYFLTFYENGQILDKRLIFEPNTITQERLTDIGLIDKPGILIS